jgi:hypothetical protein
MLSRSAGGDNPVIFTVVFATIFLVAFVILGGVVMYLSKTIDAGEARFDSTTGKPLPRENASALPAEPAKPATRLTDRDDASADGDAARDE